MKQETKLTLFRAIIRLVAFALVAFALYSTQGCASREVTVYTLSYGGEG